MRPTNLHRASQNPNPGALPPRALPTGTGLRVVRSADKPASPGRPFAASTSLAAMFWAAQ